jgi:isopenicillin-N N-acyltransferase-like protein
MLGAHRSYDEDLYEEMVAMSEASGITPAEAVIVGGFTDFVDVLRARASGAPEEDTCTAVLVPDLAADGAGFLAQTWDMHASATPHVVMLALHPDSGPAGLAFTTVGCLGQIGLNEAGIAVGINNLTDAGGRIGVTWPFVVRKVLAQSRLEDALACIVEAPLAGAHNYLIFDGNGDGFDIEAMAEGSHVIKLETEPLVHTNHCLSPVTARLEAPRPSDLLASSESRLATATEMLKERPLNEEHLMEMTREPESICRHPDPVYHVETCGAAIMRPATGDFWAVWGLPSENEYEHFTVGR